MGGICAMYSWDDQPCNRDLLRSMTNALSGRGDMTSLWCEGPVGLAVAEWQSTSVAEDQTMQEEWSLGHCRIAADVRLDNRAELFALFQTYKVPLRGDTDAALIAAAYFLWDEDCVYHLQGDFSFVLWDEQKLRLFGARSPMGVRPFVYHVCGQRLLCASEARQLFEDRVVSRELNDTWVAFWLTNGEGHWDGTIYQEIQELVPGHWISADHNGLAVQPFWEPSPREPLRYRRQEDYTEHFRSLFSDAVRTSICTSQPILFDLSGGLDSSSLVCMAGELWEQGKKKHPIHCFHAYYDASPATDARSYVRAVAEKYPVDMSYISFQEHLHFDGAFDSQPWLHQPCIPLLFLGSFYRQLWAIANALGVRVHIRGDFGDQLLGASLNYLTTYWKERHYGKLIREVRCWQQIHGVSPLAILEHCVAKPCIQKSQISEISTAPWLHDDVLSGYPLPSGVGGKKGTHRC